MRRALKTSSAHPDRRAPACDEATPASIADYIADLTTELAGLAERSELTMLAYFLNLARVEAEFRSRELADAGAVAPPAPQP